MSAKATVLLGPASAGKTTHLVAIYRDRLAAPLTLGSSLWLAPTHRTVDEIRARLIDSGLDGCLAPNCLTFSQFAEAIIFASPARIRPLDRLEKRQIIRRLVDQAVTDGRLSYFRRIAGTDGILDLISELFSDLKRQEIWPDEFTRTCQQLGNPPKDCELAELYERYQTLLNEQQLYDDEGRFWSARDLIGQDQTATLRHVSLVIVDGFADFTRTQHEILALLHERVDEMLISLPWEAGREDLFHKPTQTLAELEQRLPGLVRQVMPRLLPPPTRSLSATMAHVEKGLFGDPRSIEPKDAADGLEILAANGQLGEIELLAWKIKRLLIEGDAPGDQARIRPDDIAVVFRSTANVASLVGEVFDEYGIPFALDSRVALSRVPLISALIATLKLDFEDWPFRRLLHLLANNYFRPRWPEWRSGDASADAETAVRSLQIPKGQQALRTALARWADKELDEGASARRRRRQAAASAAHALFARLAATFDRLPARGTADQWAQALTDLADELGMLSVAREPSDLPIARHDAVAWELFQTRLKSSVDLDIRLDGEAAQLNRATILQRIELICAAEELPREYDDVGRVRVLAAADARALEVPYLFLAGLSEKAFPAAARDDRLYTSDERRHLNAAGLRFVEQHERACEEMLLFYEVVTRARRRLWLSYSALDEAAQPLSPSPYLIEVERLFRPGAVNRDEAPNLSPIPRSQEPYCVRDLRIKAIDMAVGGSTRLAGQFLERPDQRDPAQAMLAALRVTVERSRGKSFGPFEGMLQGAAAKEVLANRFGPEHCWSTSRLEQYGECPHKFFLHRILELNEVEELSLEVNRFLRGRRLHSLLAEVHRQLNNHGEPRAPSACDQEELQRIVFETLAAVIERSASEGPVESAFDAIDNRLIARWVQRYLDQHVQYDASFAGFDRPPTPTYFEVSFGPVQDEDGERTDPVSTPAAYELTCNGVTIRLSGRVDRIDVGLVKGQVVFNVLDYKTGLANGYKLKHVTACKTLQLPLYAMAVQDLLLADQNAIPWQGGYWQVREQGYNAKQAVPFHEEGPDGVRRTQLWIDLQERLTERVARLVTGIRQGEFPMYCEDEDCTGRCPYKTVCRVNAVRSLEKTWQPPLANLT